MNTRSSRQFWLILLAAIASLFVPDRSEGQRLLPGWCAAELDQPHEELAYDPWMHGPTYIPEGVVSGKSIVTRNGYTSIQVNVDLKGHNILGDAANEPSIAIDPTDPRKIVIGWRQFDTIESNFRQAGWAYSHDGGHTWVFPGVLDPGYFHSDPVLAVDASETFFHY